MRFYSIYSFISFGYRYNTCETNWEVKISKNRSRFRNKEWNYTSRPWGGIRGHMDWVNFDSFSGQVYGRRSLLPWGEQMVFPRLVKPVVRIHKMRVCQAGHTEHNLTTKRITSALWQCSQVSTECKKKWDTLGNCDHWSGMLKMAARRATGEVLGWAFVSRIGDFLILLDHPQSLLVTSHCLQGHWRLCLGRETASEAAVTNTELSLLMGLTVPGSQRT